MGFEYILFKRSSSRSGVDVVHRKMNPLSHLTFTSDSHIYEVTYEYNYSALKRDYPGPSIDSQLKEAAKQYTTAPPYTYKYPTINYFRSYFFYPFSIPPA